MNDYYTKLDKEMKKFKENELFSIYVSSVSIRIIRFKKKNLLNKDDDYIKSHYSLIRVHNYDNKTSKQIFSDVKKYIKTKFNPNYIHTLGNDRIDFLYCNNEIYKALYTNSNSISALYDGRLVIAFKLKWRYKNRDNTSYFKIPIAYKDIPLYLSLNTECEKTKQALALNEIKRIINSEIDILEKKKERINERIKEQNEKKKSFLNIIDSLPDEQKLLLELSENE